MTGQPARNRATKWTARLGLAGVSAIAAVVSYFHALAVVQAAGARAPVAYLVPFLADLVILGASAALLDASRMDQPRPPLATLALGVGIAVTLAMNVAAGVAHGLTGALVAGWPAVAFILALESLASILRRGRDGDRERSAPAVPAAHGPADPVTREAALKLLLTVGSQRSLARSLGVPRSRIEAWAAMVAPVAGEDSPAGAAVAPPLSPAGARPSREENRNGTAGAEDAGEVRARQGGGRPDRQGARGGEAAGRAGQEAGQVERDRDGHSGGVHPGARAVPATTRPPSPMLGTAAGAALNGDSPA